MLRISWCSSSHMAASSPWGTFLLPPSWNFDCSFSFDFIFSPFRTRKGNKRKGWSSLVFSLLIVLCGGEKERERAGEEDARKGREKTKPKIDALLRFIYLFIFTLNWNQKKVKRNRLTRCAPWFCCWDQELGGENFGAQ